MQQIPLSAKTSAPPSKTISEVTGSLWTAAVNPTPLEPFPVVYTALGEMCAICLINWLLATPGSPARIAPLYSMPLLTFVLSKPSLLLWFLHERERFACNLAPSPPGGFYLIMTSSVKVVTQPHYTVSVCWYFSAFHVAQTSSLGDWKQLSV